MIHQKTLKEQMLHSNDISRQHDESATPLNNSDLCLDVIMSSD